MTTINSHTLLPHAANWSFRPAWKRRWKTGLATAVDGTEQRAALRAVPLQSLTWMVTAATLPERCRLEARVDQALKTGLACAPFFGRGAALAAAAAAGTNTLTTTDAASAWPWAAGDYAVLLGADDTVFDCWQVTLVAGGVLTLAGNLANAWSAGEMLRPLIFGKFTCERLELLTDWHAAIRLTISQLAGERSAQLGAVVPDSGTGVGHQKVSSTNIIG